MDAAVWNRIWPEWQFKNVIGRGAYGVVYRAVRFLDGKEEESAIKIVTLPQDEMELEQLRAEGMTEEETQNYYASLANEFYEEIQTMKALNGSVSIVTVQDSAIVPCEDRFGWNILIRMECLTPLVEYLDGRELAEAEVTTLGIDLCRALETCEEHAILHRDIKPENIFVDKEGHFKLGDFGIAKQLEATTGAWTRVGTPFYSAPEVAEGKRYDRRVDIYSLGLVLYRLLNGGRLPFMPEKRLLTPNDRRTALERRLQGEALPAPAAASPVLAAIILKACEPRAKDRYPNAAAFREALEGTLKAAPIPWWKRSGVRIAGVILAALVTGSAVYGLAAGTLQGNKPAIVIPVGSSSTSDEGDVPGSSTREGAVFSPEGSAAEHTEATEEDLAAEPSGSEHDTEAAETETGQEPLETDSVPDPADTGTDSVPSSSGAPAVPPGAASTTPAATTKEVAAQTTPAAASTADAKPPETTVQTPETTAQSPETTAHVHSFGSWTVTKQAACTAAGERTRICSCGEKQTETVAATGHSFGNWTTVSEASCTEAGKQQRTCSRCGTLEEQTVPALGHNMVDGVCTRCGESLFTFILNGDGKSYMITGAAGTLDSSKKVIMPSSYKGLPVTQIRANAFKSYQFINGLQLPSTLTSIEENTFRYARIAGTLVIPGSVKTIGMNAFGGASLDTVIMEEGVESMDVLAFAALQGRPSITIPSTLKEGESAFTLGGSGSVTHLGTLTINSKAFLDNLVNMGYVLIDTIRVGSNVSGYCVKGNCLIRNSTGTILKAGVSFTIPTDGSAKAIDGMAFFTDFNGSPSGSTLYELRIPEGIVRIGNAAYSSVIQTVYLPHSLKDIGPNSFWGGCPKNYVYAGTMAEWITLTANPETPENDRWRERPTLLIYCTDGTLRYDTDHWAQQ